MSRQAIDQLYIDLDYFTPEEYYVYIAEAAATASSTATLECEAAVLGPVQEVNAELVAATTLTLDGNVVVGAAASLASSSEQNVEAGKIVDAAVEVGALFSPNFIVEAQLAGTALLEATTNFEATASMIASNQATLEHIVNLSLQGDKIGGLSSATLSQFEVLTQAASTREFEISLAASSSITIDGGVVADNIILQVGSFDLSVDALVVQFGDAALSAQTALDSQADIFRLRARRNVVVDAYVDSSDFSTSTKKFGSASYQLVPALWDSSKPNILLHDGSNFRIFAEDSYSSSNSTSWSNVGTSNLVITNDADLFSYYSNGYYFVRTYFGGVLDAKYRTYSSLNTTTWASAGNSIVIHHSGLTWTRLNLGSTTSWSIQTSTNYTGGSTGTWTNRASGTGTDISDGRGAIQGSTIVFAFNVSGNIRIQTSTTPTTTWSNPATINSESIKELFYGNSEWVLMTQSGKIYTSTNLSTWTLRKTITDQGRLSYAGSYYWYTVGFKLYRSTTVAGLAIVDYRFDFSSLNPIIYADSKYVSVSSQGNFLTSTDGISWSIPNITGISYSTENLIINDVISNIDLTSWNGIDFWIYPTDTRQNQFVSLRSTNGDTLLNLDSTTSTGLGLQGFYNSTTGIKTYINTASGGLFEDDWNHLRFVKNGSNLAVYVNGTRISYVTDANIGTSQLGIVIGDLDKATYMFVDEFYVTEDIINDPSLNSISVPTQPWQGSETTNVLLHFDGNFQDDTRLVFSESSSIQSNASITAVPNFVVDGITIHQSMGTLSADVGVIYENSLTIAAESTASVIGQRNRGLEAAFVAESAVSATAEKIIQYQADLSCVFSQQTDINAIFDHTAAINAESTQDIAADRLRDTLIDLTAVATMVPNVSGGFIGASAELNSVSSINAETIRIRDANAEQSSLTTLASTADRFANYEAQLASTTQQDIDYIRVRDFDVVTEAIAISISIVARTGAGFVTMESEATLAAEGRLTRGQGAALESTAEQTCLATVFRAFDISVSAASQLTAEGTTNIIGEGVFNSEFALLCDADVTGAADSAFISVGVLVVADVQVTRSVAAELTTQATQQQIVNVTRLNGADLAVVSTQITNVSALVDVGVINFGALFTPSVDFRVLRTDQYVYTIPAEVRSYSIRREARSYSIARETRNYTIRG